jgi:alkane 1-monooxygenase
LGINVAHELGHRPNRSEQFMAKPLLLNSQYKYFFVEHNKGHHKKAAAHDDPATARLKESVYAFWFRSIYWSYISAWKIQNQEIKRMGYRF